MEHENLNYQKYFIERNKSPNVFNKFNIVGDMCAYISGLEKDSISISGDIHHPVIIENSSFNKLNIFNFHSGLFIGNDVVFNEFSCSSTNNSKVVLSGKINETCTITGNQKHIEIKNAQIKSLKIYSGVDIRISESEINDINIHEGKIKSIDISETYFNKFNINENIKNIDTLQFSQNKIKQDCDGYILLKSLTIQKFSISEGLLGALKVNNCTISNCKFSNFGTEKTNDILGFNQIVFDENTQFLERLYIEGLSNFSISFQNTSFDKEVEISSCNLSMLLFENSIFKENIFIEYGNIDEFYIRGGDFLKEFKIDNSIELSNGLKMSGGKIEKLILGNTVNYLSKQIIFNGGACYDMDISIDGNRNNIDAIIFEKDFIPKNVKIIGNQSAFVQRLIFRNILVFTGTTIKLDSLSFYGIELENMANFSNIIFSGVKSTKETLSSALLEENQKPEYKYPTLKIHNSDLGKTTFIDCDFEGMELDFKSSKITEVFLAGTKMPKDITTDDNEQKRLGYGQLKKIYDNRGDTVTANEYFAKEMNVFLKKKDIGVGEKINVGLNWLSSNHGTSWLQALGTTLFISLFFFWLYGMSIGIYPTTKLTPETEGNFYSYMSYLVEFINPLHKADYIPQDFYNNDKIKISGWARFVDGISRIFITYFAYQLIQAFRKHRRGS